MRAPKSAPVSQLSATVHTASVKRLGSRTARSVPAWLSALASAVLLGAVGCGLGGFALLVRDFSEASFAIGPVTACGLGTAALVWVVCAWVGRHSWAGAAGALVATGAVTWFVREKLLEELAQAWEGLTNWVLPSGDFTVLACVAFALLGVAVGLCVFAWHAGWVLSLAALVVLALCPSEGIEPSVTGVVLLIVYTGAVVAHDYVDRLFVRRTSVVVVALVIAIAAALAAIPLATHAPQALTAPMRAVDDALDRVAALLPGGAERAAQRAADSASAALGNTGIVNRGNLDVPANQVFGSVTLSYPVGPALYLPYFRGGSYTHGSWEDATATIERLGGDPAASSSLTTAAFFTGSFYTMASSPSTVVATIASQVATIDADALRPYASIPVASEEEGVAAEGIFGIAPIGTYADLCAIGALDPAQPIGLSETPALPAASSLEAAQQLLASYAPEAQACFLDVPYEELPRVSELVAANPQATVGDAVAFVQQVLATFARYTTTPGSFPADVSIPEYLLFESHQGYCQQFATTATLMLRMYSIPARYVTGFVAPASVFEETPQDGWRATLDTQRAHAWVEIYTESMGWVPVEVTPAGTSSAAPFSDGASSSEPQAPPEQESNEPESVDETAPENEEEPSVEEEQPVEEEPAEEEDTSSNEARSGLSVGAIAAGLAVVAAIALGVWCLRLRRRRILDARNRASADGLLAETVELLHFGGLATAWEGTEDDFADELARAVPALRLPQTRAFVEEALAAAFGPAGNAKSPASPEARAVYDAACDEVYAELGGLRRLAFVWVHAFR